MTETQLSYEEGELHWVETRAGHHHLVVLPPGEAVGVSRASNVHTNALASVYSPRASWTVANRPRCEFFFRNGSKGTSFVSRKTLEDGNSYCVSQAKGRILQHLADAGLISSRQAEEGRLEADLLKARRIREYREDAAHIPSRMDDALVIVVSPKYGRASLRVATLGSSRTQLGLCVVGQGWETLEARADYRAKGDAKPLEDMLYEMVVALVERGVLSHKQAHYVLTHGYYPGGVSPRKVLSSVDLRMRSEGTKATKEQLQDTCLLLLETNERLLRRLGHEPDPAAADEREQGTYPCEVQREEYDVDLRGLGNLRWIRVRSGGTDFWYLSRGRQTERRVFQWDELGHLSLDDGGCDWSAYPPAGEGNDVDPIEEGYASNALAAARRVMNVLVEAGYLSASQAASLHYPAELT